MTKNTGGSFFTRTRQKLFRFFVEREIFDRIMPHVLGEKNHGYSFASYDEMDAETEGLDLQGRLDRIEGQIREMPEAYARSFRHILHRELSERLRAYELVARRHVRRTCDPRFVARRLEPST